MLEDLPDRALRRGQVGTIVERLAPGVYEIEFSDDEGRTYASLPLRSDQLPEARAPSRAEPPGGLNGPGHFTTLSAAQSRLSPGAQGQERTPATVRPEQIRSARLRADLTQQKAARQLGVSQAYLALLEGGRRPITPPLASKIIRLYELGPTALPLEIEGVSSWDSASLASALAGLGYPGFRHLRRGARKNPAIVILAGVTTEDIEVRVIEALPWVMVQYSDLDWDWLIRESKLRDVQNRLGFLVALAWEVAEKLGEVAAADRLQEAEKVLDRARLVREDTLCQSSLSDAERRWLRRSRPPNARHWNLLTDLDAGSLHYGD